MAEQDGNAIIMGAAGDDERREQTERILAALGIRAPYDEAEHVAEGFMRDDMGDLEENILDSRRAFDGGFLKVDEVEIELPNGNIKHHEVIRHPGAVGIIALDNEDRVLLVNQYRTALERVTLEIPAGKLEPGEDARECALRELAEETGYVAGKMTYLIPIAVAVGYSDEIIHLFIATDLKAGTAHPDDDEFVASQWMDLSELIDLVLDGRIEDSKTVIAALALDAMGRRLA
jgi:ADP-ribose pyrophosphatase